MTGPTSEAAIAHTCELVERHAIIVPANALPGGIKAAFDTAKLHAEAWARAHGGLEVANLKSHINEDTSAGVIFEVHVGHGDIALDQRVAGVLDRWRWSARMTWWRRVLTNADGRKGALLAKAEDGKASVTRIHARTGSATGVEPGCTCALGGPFTEVCPVHFHSDS